MPSEHWHELIALLKKLPTPVGDSRIDLLAESNSVCTTIYPAWSDIERAIKQIDGRMHCHVQLHTSSTPIEYCLSVVDENAIWCLKGLKFEWELNLPHPCNDRVCLWAEKGLECPVSRTMDQLAFVLEMAKGYYDTSSFSAVQMIGHEFQRGGML